MIWLSCGKKKPLLSDKMYVWREGDFVFIKSYCVNIFHKVKLKRACLKNLLLVITNFHLVDSNMFSLPGDPGFTLDIFGKESREKIIHISLSGCSIMSIGAGGNA